MPGTGKQDEIEKLIRAIEEDYGSFESDLIVSLEQNQEESHGTKNKTLADGILDAILSYDDDDPKSDDKLYEQKKKLKEKLRASMDNLKKGIIRPEDAPKMEKTRAIFTDHPEKDSLYIRMDKAFKANESLAHWLTKKATFGGVDTSKFNAVKDVIFSGPEREEVMKRIDAIKKNNWLLSFEAYCKCWNSLYDAIFNYYRRCCDECFKCLKERSDILKKVDGNLDKVSANELAKCYLLLAAVHGKRQNKEYNFYSGIVGEQCRDITIQFHDLYEAKFAEYKKAGKKIE